MIILFPFGFIGTSSTTMASAVFNLIMCSAMIAAGVVLALSVWALFGWLLITFGGLFLVLTIAAMLVLKRNNAANDNENL